MDPGSCCCNLSAQNCLTLNPLLLLGEVEVLLFFGVFDVETDFALSFEDANSDAVISCNCARRTFLPPSTLYQPLFISREGALPFTWVYAFVNSVITLSLSKFVILLMLFF